MPKGSRRVLALFILALLVIALIALPTARAADCLYTVQPGDTLSSIASRYCISPNDIVVTNKLPDPNYVAPGTVLVIPNCGSCPVAAPTATLPPSVPTPFPQPPPTATPVSSDAAFTAYMASWPRVEFPVNQYTVLGLLGNPPAPPPLSPQVSAMVDAATIQILVASGATTATGSGVVIGTDGTTILTTYSLVGDLATGQLKSPVAIYVGPYLNYTLRADVVATDLDNDLAIIRVLPTPGFTGFAFLTVADSSTVGLTDPTYLYGYAENQSASLDRATGILTGIFTVTATGQVAGFATNAALPSSVKSGFAVNGAGHVIGAISLAPRVTATMNQSGLPMRTALIPSNVARTLFEPVTP